MSISSYAALAMAALFQRFPPHHIHTTKELLVLIHASGFWEALAVVASIFG